MRLAIEAGFLNGDLELFPETIERFAQLVRTDECEAIARMFETKIWLMKKEKLSQQSEQGVRDEHTTKNS